MNVAIIGNNYCDFQLCTIVDGLQDLGHTVYELSGPGLNYMEPDGGRGIDGCDLLIVADTYNRQAVSLQVNKPKVIVHGHDRWGQHLSTVKPIEYHTWICDIAFVRDWDGTTNDKFPVYPMEFGIERRYTEACVDWHRPVSERKYDIGFYGTYATAGRGKVIKQIEKKFTCDFGHNIKFCSPDSKWSKWVYGRYVHDPCYYQALTNVKFALSPLGAGPSCGRTYEAYAAGCIPLIQAFPPEIKQISAFTNENSVLWKTADDIIRVVKQMLRKDRALDKFQKKCHEFGQKNLLSKHRVQYMLDRIQEHGVI